MSDAMGLLRIDVEIESHHAQGERRLLRQQIRFQQADGPILTRWVGFAVLHVPDAFSVDEVVFGEPGDQVLLGARTLEGMNLKVDLVGKRLVSAGPMMAALAA